MDAFAAAAFAALVAGAAILVRTTFERRLSAAGECGVA